MLKNAEKKKKSCGVNTARFLKKVWPFFNIMNERVKRKNCGQLSPTSVTMEIFSNIPAHNRSQDVKNCTKLQKLLLNSSESIVKIFDNILTNSSKQDKTLINISKN